MTQVKTKKCAFGCCDVEIPLDPEEHMAETGSKDKAKCAFGCCDKNIEAVRN